MKRKKIKILTMILVALLAVLTIFLCRDQEEEVKNPQPNHLSEESKDKEESDVIDDDEKDTTSKKEDDSEQEVPEDEVTLDYEAVKDEDDTSDADDASGVEGSTTPGTGGSDTSENKPNGGTSGSGNPYDKDGDGYVDGWY